MILVIETVRVSMNVTELIIAMGISFALGAIVGLWVGR